MTARARRSRVAIFEHYLPRGATDALPTLPVAFIGLADRLDTVVGCFAVGLAPTGSADAFGLRRAALAILNILLARGIHLPLGELIDGAARALTGKIQWTPELRTQILEFVRTRLRGLLVAETAAASSTGLRGLPADCVDAALAAGFEDVPDALARAEAVAALRARPDFEPLGIAFKRVANIIKGEKSSGTPSPDRFVHASESAPCRASPRCGSEPWRTPPTRTTRAPCSSSPASSLLSTSSSTTSW